MAFALLQCRMGIQSWGTSKKGDRMPEDRRSDRCMVRARQGERDPWDGRCERPEQIRFPLRR